MVISWLFLALCGHAKSWCARGRVFCCLNPCVFLLRKCFPLTPPLEWWDAGLVCFVINPCVLLTNRVDFGLFVSEKFPLSPLHLPLPLTEPERAINPENPLWYMERRRRPGSRWLEGVDPARIWPLCSWCPGKKKQNIMKTTHQIDELFETRGKLGVMIKASCGPKKDWISR